MKQAYVSLSASTEAMMKDYRRYIEPFMRANFKLVLNSDFAHQDSPNIHPSAEWVLGRERIRAIESSKLALFYVAGDTGRQKPYELDIARRSKVPIFVYSPNDFQESFSSEAFLCFAEFGGIPAFRHSSKLELAIRKELGLAVEVTT